MTTSARNMLALASFARARRRCTPMSPTASLARRPFSHVPVMAEEIIELLRPQDGQVFIDMTFGGGGHTRRLLDTNKSIKVIAVDRDPLAYRKAQDLAAEVAVKSERLGIEQSVVPVLGKFSSVMQEIHMNGVEHDSVHGVIFDLGASSMQFDDPARGFALSASGPLDMRMDPTCQTDITAEDVVNNLSQEKLALIFKELGGEKRSRKIANAIVDARTLLGRIKTTHELARIITSSSSLYLDALGRQAHPGTKVFQALRIFVNNELNEINYAPHKISQFLIPAQATLDDPKKVEDIPGPYGTAAVLTFHSLEDRIVKRHFTGVDPNEPVVKSLSQHDRIRTNLPEQVSQVEAEIRHSRWRPLFKHVRRPSAAEIEANPRSRSAKLRAAMRIA